MSYQEISIFLWIFRIYVDNFLWTRKHIGNFNLFHFFTVRLIDKSIQTYLRFLTNIVFPLVSYSNLEFYSKHKQLTHRGENFLNDRRCCCSVSFLVFFLCENFYWEFVYIDFLEHISWVAVFSVIKVKFNTLSLLYRRIR